MIPALLNAGRLALLYEGARGFLGQLLPGSATPASQRREPFGRSQEKLGDEYASEQNLDSLRKLAAGIGGGVYAAQKISTLRNMLRGNAEPDQQIPPPPSPPPAPVIPPPAPQQAQQPQQAPNPLQSILTPDILQRLTPEQAQQVNNRVRMMEKLQANPTESTPKQIENLLGEIKQFVGENVQPQKKSFVQEETERLEKAYPQGAQMVQKPPEQQAPKQLKPFTNVPQQTADQFNKSLALAVNSLNQKPIRFRTEEGGYSTDLASIKKPTKSQTDSIFKRLIQTDPRLGQEFNKLSGPQRRVARNQLVGNFLDQVKGSKVPEQVQRVESARDKVERLTTSRNMNNLLKEREWLEAPAALGQGTNADLILKMIREEL